jgi:hypothetical protein
MLCLRLEDVHLVREVGNTQAQAWGSTERV